MLMEIVGSAQSPGTIIPVGKNTAAQRLRTIPDISARDLVPDNTLGSPSPFPLRFLGWFVHHTRGTEYSSLILLVSSTVPFEQ